VYVTRVGFVLLIALIPSLAHAACDSGSAPTWTVNSWVSLQSCHDSVGVLNGHTITVAPGSYTVTTNTRITKAITISMVGVHLTDNITIYNGSNPDSTTPLLTIVVSPSGNIVVNGGASPPSVGGGPADNGSITTNTSHVSPTGVITVQNSNTGDPAPWVVRGLVFMDNTGNGDHLYLQDVHNGVLYGNKFTANLIQIGGGCFNQASAMRMRALDIAFSTPPTYGTADIGQHTNIYIENNEFTNLAQALDFDDFTRGVVRFNKFTSSSPSVHGDTSIGGRHYEVYKNAFYTPSVTALCTSLGGSGMNQFSGWTLRSATSRFVSNYIQDADLSAGGFGLKAGIFFTAEQLTRQVGTWACWVGTGTIGNAQYPTPHNAGWGYSVGGTTVGQSAPPYSPVSMDLEPIYLAGNFGGSPSYSGNYINPGTPSYQCNNCPGSGSDVSCDCASPGVCATRNTSAQFIQSDREYYRDLGGCTDVATCSPTYTGASGTGAGPRSSRPATCTPGTAWWATDQGAWNTLGTSTASGIGGNGVLDLCTATNTWTNSAYTPSGFPHPLTGATLPINIRGGLSIPFRQ
jgi:hypothetical protein